MGKGMALVLMLSLPCVLTAAGIGLVVGILQAVTQVQEQTIAAAPKIVAVFMVLIFGGGMMVNIVSDYVRESFQLAFEEIPRADGPYILPPRTDDEATQQARAFFHDEATHNLGNLQKIENAPTPSFDNGGKGGMPVMKPSGGGNPNSLPERMTLNKNNH